MDIQIVFKHVGNAPILRQTKYSYRLNLERNQPFVELINYLDHLLWPEPHQKQPLYLYINSIFIPAMDEQLVNLYKVIHYFAYYIFTNKCFAIDGTLYIHYSLVPAWR